MKKYLFLIWSIILAGIAQARKNPVTTSSSDLSSNYNSNMASTEILKSFKKWTTAWNEGNIEGYLDGYADLPSVRYVSGKQVTKGKENIMKLFRDRGARGVLELLNLESECISDCDAICFGQYKLVLERIPDDDVQETHEGCFTVHVRKIEGQWKIMSDHSS